jgi:hypothetical protein
MSSSASISTLSEFLLQAQTQYMLLDLGRGIRKINTQTFFDWEKQLAPCAFPRQDHGWFCVVFWNEKLSADQYIWFIKLPLDESGLIINAALSQFLEIIVQALGKQLEHTSNNQAQLPENPFVFTPSQQQLADCNAHIRKELALQSRVSSTSSKYLQAPNTLKDEQAWAALSLQDIADFAIYPSAAVGLAGQVKPRQAITTQAMPTQAMPTQAMPTQKHATQTIIANNLHAYAPAVLSCLFASLESVELHESLAQALIDFHKRTASQPLPENNGCDALASSNALRSLCLRAMSFKPLPLTIEYVTQIINSGGNNKPDAKAANDSHQSNDPLDLETCVVIAGRYWSLLNHESRLQAFMHKVALLDNSYQLFKGLYSDLVKIPETRNTMLRFIRQPERSEEVSKAIGALFAK